MRDVHKWMGVLHEIDLYDKKTSHPLYTIWRGMKSRCYCKTDVAYKYYGGRGISVCKAWRDNFAIFLYDMGNRPEGTSIDRINNNGNYKPDNCRWATQAQQMMNRSNSRLPTEAK